MSRVEANFPLLAKYTESGCKLRKCIARSSMLPACFCSVDLIPRKLRHLRFLHRGGMARRKSCILCVRATSLSARLDLLPNFPVLGIVAVVAATLVSSPPQNVLSRRRQPCAASSIIVSTRRPTEPTRKCVPAGTTMRRPSKQTPPTQ